MYLYLICFFDLIQMVTCRPLVTNYSYFTGGIHLSYKPSGGMYCYEMLRVHITLDLTLNIHIYMQISFYYLIGFFKLKIV